MNTPTRLELLVLFTLHNKLILTVIAINNNQLQLITGIGFSMSVD